MRTLITLVITLVAFVSVAVAQWKKNKIEIGVQSTGLSSGHRVRRNEGGNRWQGYLQLQPVHRYGEIEFPGLPASFTVPSVTRHNLQVASGIGFRF